MKKIIAHLVVLISLIQFFVSCSSNKQSGKKETKINVYDFIQISVEQDSSGSKLFYARNLTAGDMSFLLSDLNDRPMYYITLDAYEKRNITEYIGTHVAEYKMIILEGRPKFINFSEISKSRVFTFSDVK